MGHGIAQVAAQSGYEVVLREVDERRSRRASARSRSSSRAPSRRASRARRTPTPCAGASHGTTALPRPGRLRSRDRGDHREPRAEARDVEGGRRDRQAGGDLRDEHLLAGGDRPGRRDRPPGAVRRAALLQPGAGDEAGRGRPLRDDQRRGVRRRRCEFARSEGKLAIPTKDKAGFIVNRLLVPYMLDAIRASKRASARSRRSTRR